MHQPYELAGIEVFKEISAFTTSNPHLNKDEADVWSAISKNPSFPDIKWAKDLNHWHYFKYRFFRKLVTHVVDNDRLASTPYAQECKSAYFDYYLFKMLTFGQLVRSASYFAKSLLKRSIKFHIPDLVIPLAKYLMRYYATEDFNKTKIAHYAEIAEEYLNYQKFEFKAERYYCEYDATLKLETRLTSQNSQRAAELKSLMSIVPTVNFQLCARIFIYLHDSDRQLDALDVAEEGLEYINSLDFEHRAGSIIFSWFYIQELIKRNDTVVCLNFIEDRLLHFGHKKDHNYYLLLEYKLKLSLKTFDVRTSTKILQKFSQERNRVRKDLRNRIKLYKLYLGILNGELKHLRTSKVISKLDHFSRDKSGWKLALIIGELLLHIQKGNVEFVVESQEKIHQYLYSHRVSPSRDSIFIKLLCTCPYLHTNSGRTKANKYLQQLDQLRRSSDFEIIDYKELWSRWVRQSTLNSATAYP